MIWRIESFTPSDGSKQGFVTVDHQAWLRGDPGDPGDAATVYVSLNMSSKDVSEDDARRFLGAMVAGLNAMEAPAEQERNMTAAGHSENEMTHR